MSKEIRKSKRQDKLFKRWPEMAVWRAEAQPAPVQDPTLAPSSWLQQEPSADLTEQDYFEAFGPDSFRDSRPPARLSRTTRSDRWSGGFK